MELTVVDVVAETDDACSILLEGDDPVDYKPGQFLTVAVPSSRSGTVARCYSLSSAPHEVGPLKITVRRTTDGYGSNWLCDNVRPGDALLVLPPSGIFTPADLDDDFLLFAAGSGITPVISIAKSALMQGSGQVVLVDANRDERSVIFAEELRGLAARHPDRFVVVHWLESVRGVPTQEQMKELAAPFPDHDAFVCGPAPFMTVVVAALKELGFPRERRHQEKFVSLGGDPFGDVARQRRPAAQEGGDDLDPARRPEAVRPPARVHGDLHGEEFSFDDWPRDKVLLDFLLARGVRAPFSCREGKCSTCECVVLEGEVVMERNEVLDDDDLAEGVRLACQSLPVSDSVRITYSR